MSVQGKINNTLAFTGISNKKPNDKINDNPTH